jgi:NCS1 family nucleobase:cation symporter-1
MIVDYFLVKRQAYDLVALYKDDAGYPAWNISGMAAFVVPVTLTIGAIAIGPDSGWYYDWFYSYGWFTGSTLGGVIYYLLNRG